MPPRASLAFAFSMLVAAGARGDNAEAPADLVLRHGRIVTVDPARPQVEALAARHGRIVAVGSDAEIVPFIGPATRVVDLAGRLATPGLIEGHAHFAGLGQSLRILRLGRHASWQAIVDEVAAAAATARPGAWILGRGWHQEKWDAVPADAVEGFPVRAALDRVAPRNPVALEHASGHATIANAAALAAAGIGRHTPDPPGGEILHDARGEPTGLLRESAALAVEDAHAAALAALPAEIVDAEKRLDLEVAARAALEMGITTFQDAGAELAELDRMAAIAAGGGLGVRLWVMVRDRTEALLAADLERLRRVDPAGHFTVRALKVVGDGALGSRGAWLLEPYADLPGHVGLAVTDPAEVERLSGRAIEHGFQMAVHALGDRAVRETLDVYERVFAAHPGAHDLRWRIEHVQHLHPDDVPRFGRLGVVASVQGIHCTSDAPWIALRLGERRAEERSYRWRDLVDAGAVLINGTDAPVEPVDPIPNFYATVARRLPDGSRFVPGQALTRQEALESMTIRAAWAAFEDATKGSLTPGKLADVTVFSQDLLSVPEEEIPATRVEMTIVGGRVLYERPAGADPAPALSPRPDGRGGR